MIRRWRPVDSRLLEILLAVSAAGIWNIGATLMDAWQDHWRLLLFVDFILLVIIAEYLVKFIPVRFKTAYDRILALGFPLMLLICWEALVKEDIINARWFPAPSSIGQALWDLTVEYDR